MTERIKGQLLGGGVDVDPAWVGDEIPRGVWITVTQVLEGDATKEQILIQYNEAIDLLKRCYQSGHREGWEEGEATDEVMNAVRHWLDASDPGWGKNNE